MAKPILMRTDPRQKTTYGNGQILGIRIGHTTAYAEGLSKATAASLLASASTSPGPALLPASALRSPNASPSLNNSRDRLGAVLAPAEDHLRNTNPAYPGAENINPDIIFSSRNSDTHLSILGPCRSNLRASTSLSFGAPSPPTPTPQPVVHASASRATRTTTYAYSASPLFILAPTDMLSSAGIDMQIPSLQASYVGRGHAHRRQRPSRIHPQSTHTLHSAPEV
ncbi:hypothetical protein B0H13DRAFT_2347529 [Mycena leptocephala]|nr:hypothetical protein B0H13DRAFT_2347529 [Mycena leptocephala]